MGLEDAVVAALVRWRGVGVGESVAGPAVCSGDDDDGTSDG